MAHGSPHDEDEYVMAGDEAATAFAYLECRLAFLGHTHVQGGYLWNRARVEAIPRTPTRSGSRTIEIDPDCAYLVNPGSVGQPRDGDPRAAFALYDSGANTVDYRRVSYDVERTSARSAKPACRPPWRTASARAGSAGGAQNCGADAFGWQSKVVGSNPTWGARYHFVRTGHMGDRLFLRHG